MIVFGHSLGKAIATRMIADYDMETGGNSSVDGLILEAPFNNMYDEVMTYGAAKAFAAVGMDVRQRLVDSGLVFDTQHWLPAVKCPVLVMHAEDDKVVPYELGKALYDKTLAAGKTNIRMVTFPKNLKCGHNDIFTAEDMEAEVRTFVEEAVRGGEWGENGRI